MNKCPTGKDFRKQSRDTLRVRCIVLCLLVLGSGACSPTSRPATQTPPQPVTKPSPQPAKDPNALAHLVELLKDPNPDVRSSAAAALGELDDVRALPPLIKLAATEPDAKVLRSVATALAVIGAARGNDKLTDDLVSRLMTPAPKDWRGEAEARDTITFLREVVTISIHISWRCFPDTAQNTPVRLDELAGRPVIGAWAVLVAALKPKEDVVFLLTPAINIISLQDATAWHQKDRQLRVISESRRKLASATEKGRATLKRLEARIQGIPDDRSLAKFITKVADLAKLEINVDWEDLKKHGYNDEAGCEFPVQKFTVGDYMDYIEFFDSDNGTTRGMSFLVEPDGSVTIAALDTIAKRLADRAGG